MTPKQALTVLMDQADAKKAETHEANRVLLKLIADSSPRARQVWLEENREPDRVALGRILEDQPLWHSGAVHSGVPLIFLNEEDARQYGEEHYEEPDFQPVEVPVRLSVYD